QIETLPRADTRSPMQIFGSTHIVGPGFLTWAATRGVTANYDVLSYARGETVAPGEMEVRTAGWVSAAGDLEGVVVHFLNHEFLEREEGHPNYWVYQIAPTNRAYSMNWMLEGVVDALDESEEHNQSVDDAVD
ncbi:hypothetical protein ACR9PT_14955, partial [Piscirickettsia salmonis]|uniref:hypothetical protein n=1 Tax=Piscirickettsia salmonis TaxID=1238 RepID=UPI003EC14899